jgi:AcrR family transcriptional regulator
MDDIALATGITARALYRHYANKQALLSHVVIQDQNRLLAALAEGDGAPRQATLNEVLAALAAASLTSLRLGPLWQREARHLAKTDFARVREGTRAIAAAVKRAVVDTFPELDPYRAELRAWATVSIVTSPGYYELSLPRGRFTNLLIAASVAAVTAPAPDPDPRPLPTPGSRERAFTSRREQLIASAASSFRRRGYAGVGIDDFGADSGVAGPAIYRYFDSKADVLVAVINRFQEWVAHENSRALRAADADSAVLAGLVAGYLRVGMEATDLLAVTLTESRYLPEGSTERFRRMLADDLGEWAHWLRVARPELAETDVQALVNASRTVIDDLVRIPHLSQDPRFAAELKACVVETLYRAGPV